MRDQVHDESSSRGAQHSERAIAIALATAILICLVTFIWIFVSIEPFMRDFTGSDVVIVPDPDDPLSSPTVTVEITE